MTEPRYTRSDLTVANLFTGARLALIPVFGYLWAVGANAGALWVFGVAVATDLVDGFLARYLNQKSRLGALIDPIADKLLIFVSLVVGSYLGVVPIWLAAVVIGRDAVLGVGILCFATVWRGRHPPEEWRPTRIGKYAMFFQSLSILGAILRDLTPLERIGPFLQFAMIGAGALTLVAGTQYVLDALGALRRTAARPGREGAAGERAPT